VVTSGAGQGQGDDGGRGGGRARLVRHAWAGRTLPDPAVAFTPRQRRRVCGGGGAGRGTACVRGGAPARDGWLWATRTHARSGAHPGGGSAVVWHRPHVPPSLCLAHRRRGGGGLAGVRDGALAPPRVPQAVTTQHRDSEPPWQMKSCLETILFARNGFMNIGENTFGCAWVKLVMIPHEWSDWPGKAVAPPLPRTIAPGPPSGGPSPLPPSLLLPLRRRSTGRPASWPADLSTPSPPPLRKAATTMTRLPPPPAAVRVAAATEATQPTMEAETVGRGGGGRCCQADPAVALRPHQNLGRRQRRELWRLYPEERWQRGRNHTEQCQRRTSVATRRLRAATTASGRARGPRATGGRPRRRAEQVDMDQDIENGGGGGARRSRPLYGSRAEEVAWQGRVPRWWVATPRRRCVQGTAIGDEQDVGGRVEEDRSTCLVRCVGAAEGAREGLWSESSAG